MSDVSKKILDEVLEAFDFGAPVVGAARYSSGHINDTFCVHVQPENTCCHCFILQRMSAAAFKRPDQLMSNVIGVTEYLAKKIIAAGGDRSREAMEVIRPRNGEDYYTDSEGGAWRVFPFITDICCYQSAETPELFEASAYAFGKFQRMLDGYPADTLFETIPHFHDTEDRLRKLKEAIAADKVGRLKEVSQEVDFIMAREKDCGLLLDLQAKGEIVERTTHNDTKLNNVLIDDATGKGICVIDLDTVMPGLPHYDFGDMVRTGTSPAAEDEKDLSKVRMRFEMFEALLRGYLSAAGKFLNPLEKSLLPFSGKLITMEIGIRFLTDYLSGDVYFKVKRPGHNLDRCRTQLKLVASIEEQFDAMRKLTDSL